MCSINERLGGEAFEPLSDDWLEELLCLNQIDGEQGDAGDAPEDDDDWE